MRIKLPPFCRDTALKWLCIVSLLWGLGVTLKRGFQFPLQWAQAHWLVGYDFGFIKRALVGTLFKSIISPTEGNSNFSEQQINTAATVVFFFFVTTLVVMTVRMIRKLEFSSQSIMTAAVFFTSPYIVMSAHLNGYYDNILVMLTVGAILLIRRDLFFFGSVLLSIGVLVHETIFVIGFPSALFAALMVLIRNTNPSLSGYKRISRAFLRLLLFLLPVLTLFILWINQEKFLDHSILRNQIYNYFIKHSFIDDYNARNVSGSFVSSFYGLLKHQLPLTFKYLLHKVYFAQILPTFFLLIISIRYAILQRFSGSLFWIALLINLCPFVLFIIATDTSRLWNYTLITAMLTLWTVCDFEPNLHINKKSSCFFELMCSSVLVLNSLLYLPLMEGRRDQFSFDERIVLYLPFILIIGYIVSQRHQDKNPNKANNH